MSRCVQRDPGGRTLALPRLGRPVSRVPGFRRGEGCSPSLPAPWSSGAAVLLVLCLPSDMVLTIRESVARLFVLPCPGNYDLRFRPCLWPGLARSCIGCLDEPVAVTLGQVPRVAEERSSLNKPITMARHCKCADLGHVILGPPPRRGRRRDVVRVQLQRTRAGVVGRAVGVGIAVEAGLAATAAVVLQGVHRPRPDCPVESGLPLRDVCAPPRGFGLEKEVGRGRTSKHVRARRYYQTAQVFAHRGIDVVIPSAVVEVGHRVDRGTVGDGCQIGKEYLPAVGNVHVAAYDWNYLAHDVVFGTYVIMFDLEAFESAVGELGKRERRPCCLKQICAVVVVVRLRLAAVQIDMVLLEMLLEHFVIRRRPLWRRAMSAWRSRAAGSYGSTDLSWFGTLRW